ncbi:MAG: hypothetical protein ACI4R9_05895 [Kiritimatiellia bacterium]
MQKLISKYGLAAHLALLAVAPLFLFPFFTSAQIATAELWLCAVGFIWTLMEPSRRSGELLHDARARVVQTIVRDPLVWIMVAVTVFAAIRWANGGIALRCDFNGGSPFWYLSEPSCAFLPGSVAGRGYAAFVGVLTAFVLIIGCGHALGKMARVAFLFIVSALAGLAAFAAIGLCLGGNAAVLQALWCANMKTASFVGPAFGLNLIAGIAALIGAFEFRWNRAMLLFVFAIGGNLAGLYFFAPTCVVLVFLAAAVVILLIALVYAFLELGIPPTTKSLAILLMTLLIAALAVIGVSFLGEKSQAGAAQIVRTVKMSRDAEYAPVTEHDLAQSALYLASVDRVAFAAGGSLFPHHFAERRAVLSDVAARIWKEHPWLGVGLGAYRLALRFSATPADWKTFNSRMDGRSLVEALKRSLDDVEDPDRPQGFVPVPSAWDSIGAEQVETPFNGWWTLLAERGLIGALALAAVLGGLVFHFVRRLIGAFGRRVFVPSCAVGIVALLALIAETFIDGSFLRPEVLATGAAFLTLSASSLPPARKHVREGMEEIAEEESK